MNEQVPRVVIGMDPHKRSVTVEVMTADESVIGGGRFDTTIEDYAEGRAYFDRKKAGGKTLMEAMRCLKRRLSDIVYRTMLGDYTAATMRGPGRATGSQL